MTEQTPQAKDGALKSQALIKVERAEAKLHSERQIKKTKQKDMLKLAVAILLVVAGVWAYYSVPNLPVFVSALFPVVAVILALLIVFYWCDSGRRLIAYVRDSVSEFKKVVWPVRNDAIRLTFFVVVFVAILASFIYGVDSLVSWLFFDLILRRG